MVFCLVLIGFSIANILTQNYSELTITVMIILAILMMMQTGRAQIYVKQLRRYEEIATQILESHDFIPVLPLVIDHKEIVGVQYNRLMRLIQKRESNSQLNKQIFSIITSIIEAPLVVIDVNGTVDYANNSFKMWFAGRTVEKIPFQKVGNKTLRRIMQDALICETTRKSELQMNQKFYTSTSSPIYDEQQLFKGVVILFHDITHFKKYQSLQKDFFSNASHELKTPISAIKGCTEILLNGEHDEKMVTDFLTIIDNENRRLERLVKDLLLINRYDFAQIKLKKQKICLNKLIAECMLKVLNIASLKGQKIFFDDSIEINYKGDYSKLQQCFLNLLTNAIHYSGENTVITIKIWKEKRTVKIQVIDQGIGIPEKDLPHIFERFYRVDKARSRHTGGSGLGLSIVQSIISVHGGRINVESLQEQGTTFTVIL